MFGRGQPTKPIPLVTKNCPPPYSPIPGLVRARALIQHDIDPATEPKCVKALEHAAIQLTCDSDSNIAAINTALRKRYAADKKQGIDKWKQRIREDQEDHMRAAHQFVTARKRV
eukprot:6234878-Amphidinium_carterae.1